MQNSIYAIKHAALAAFVAAAVAFAAQAGDLHIAQSGQAAPATPPAPSAPAPAAPAPSLPAAPAAPATKLPPIDGPLSDSLKGHALTPDEAASPPQFDLAALPFAARKMHELLLEAAQAGAIEKLRPYAGVGDNMTLFSFGGVEGDPIEFLKSLSGDGEGYEILAIMQDVLQAGFVQLEAGTENEIFVWPYFHALPIESLTPAQRVELYRLVTHDDYEDMKGFGAYNFYRVGITPDGRWQFFVAGD